MLIKPLPAILFTNFSFIFWYLLGIYFTKTGFRLCLYCSLADCLYQDHLTTSPSRLYLQNKVHFLLFSHNPNATYHVLHRIRRLKRMQVFMRICLLLCVPLFTFITGGKHPLDLGEPTLLERFLVRKKKHNKNDLLSSHF